MSIPRELSWLASGVVLAPGLPVWAACAAVHPRLRGDLRGRFGLDVPPVAPGAVWIHAASVGEVNACESLIESLPGPILLTADTDTGATRARELARQVGPRVQAGVRPTDHWFTLAPLWAASQPRGLVFVEGSWWPKLAAMARRTQVPVLRVSAKAGPRTRSLARRWWYAPWTRDADLIVARDAEQAEWFRSHSYSEVVVGTSIKYEGKIPHNPLSWRRDFVVFGSVRKEEEEGVVQAILSLHKRYSILLAPRYLSQVERLQQALREAGLTAALRSTLTSRDADRDASVVLLDTLGELASCYDGAAACFIGGTFCPEVGGHSPIEAHIAGVPVAAGPQIWSQGKAFDLANATIIDTMSDIAQGILKAVPPGPPPSPRRTEQLIRDMIREQASSAVSPRPWAAPLTPLWVGAGFVRSQLHWLRRRGEGPNPVPVICVGSANARGPGKTSVAHWFARTLREQGHTVGVITHGYNGTARSRPILSTESTSPALLGDEGALLAYYGFLVAVARDRRLALRALAAEGVTVVIMDDGLQQGLVLPNIRIAVTDDRFPNAHGVIPAGYRRSWRSLPADIDGEVHLNGARVGCYGVQRWGQWHLGDSPIAKPPGGSWVAFSAIARPSDFIQGLDHSLHHHIRFPDHHVLSRDEWDDLLVKAEGRPLVCTAKDWIKLPKDWARQVYWRDRFVDVKNPDPKWTDADQLSLQKALSPDADKQRPNAGFGSFLDSIE
jgi:3-deoxy-D-manno-octulosonic-acid transferase